MILFALPRWTDAQTDWQVVLSTGQCWVTASRLRLRIIFTSSCPQFGPQCKASSRLQNRPRSLRISSIRWMPHFLGNASLHLTYDVLQWFETEKKTPQTIFWCVIPCLRCVCLFVRHNLNKHEDAQFSLPYPNPFCPRRNTIPTRTIIRGGWVSSSSLSSTLLKMG